MISKLKCTPGIYLVGFMGCGKTVIGDKLAERLGWSFADLDTDVEREQNTTISEIFDLHGEEEFRRLETDALRKRVRMIQSGRPMVVALGGGAFGQTRNFDLIENNGVSIWLDCPLPTIRRRLEGCTHRPLARDPVKLEILYYTRQDSYARADHRIEIADDQPELVVEAVLKLPLF